MKAVKILVVVALVYVGVVALFESLLGTLQPQGEGGSTLVITTFDPSGAAHDRVVGRLESDGHLYVAANHWPRAWYRRALANPDVKVTLEGKVEAYRAVPVSGEERQQVATEHPLGIGFRLLTGFAPRKFLRLDPRQVAASPP